MWEAFLGCDHTRIRDSQMASFDGGRPNEPANNQPANNPVRLQPYA